MNSTYLDRITLGDCRIHLPNLVDESIDLFLSDIPYGISFDEWDVLHQNKNAGLLGSSPAQVGKAAFKRRGKPLNGWLEERNIGKEYQEWCSTWAGLVFPKLKPGASVFVFGARRTIHRVINAFEDGGFILRDTLAWKKDMAFDRAQRISIVFNRRGLKNAAEEWRGWRVGNLAPIYEPIAWFMKPCKQGTTIADNVLTHGIGAMNIERCKIRGANPTNVLEFGFHQGEKRIHEAQKPVQLIEFLIKLTTRDGQVVLDPFMGSGTTAVAAKRLNRHFIGFEVGEGTYRDANLRIESIEKQALLW